MSAAELACWCGDEQQRAGTYVQGCPRHVALQMERGPVVVRKQAAVFPVEYFRAEVLVAVPKLVPAAESSSGVDEVWSEQRHVSCDHKHDTVEQAERCARKLARRAVTP